MDRLSARIRARDARAFEALYDEHHRLVYGIALRMLGDTLAAEDVTQSVFMKLWTSPDLFHGGNSPAWIARIARNRSIDVLRRRASHADVELPAELPEGEVFKERAIARADNAKLHAALAALPSEQREPIELGFFGGLTQAEIARRSNTPLGTVKTRIRSGLHELHRALDGART